MTRAHLSFGLLANHPLSAALFLPFSYSTLARNMRFLWDVQVAMCVLSRPLLFIARPHLFLIYSAVFCGVGWGLYSADGRSRPGLRGADAHD
jgi:hypothetical protein